MSPKQKAAMHRRIADSMANLSGNPNFQDFIDLIRDYRDQAVEDLCSDRVVSNKRRTWTQIGAVATFNSIISIYESARDAKSAANDSQ